MSPATSPKSKGDGSLLFLSSLSRKNVESNLHIPHHKVCCHNQHESQCIQHKPRLRSPESSEYEEHNYHTGHYHTQAIHSNEQQHHAPAVKHFHPKGSNDPFDGIHHHAAPPDRGTGAGVTVYDSKPPRYAFATVLTAGNDLEYPDIEEPYLQAARLLTFQLLRNPRTRNRIDNVPFLILVTPDISQKHRDILSREGATVVPVENLDYDWGSSQHWDTVLAKLNLWKLDEYDKIAFLNVDSVILRPIYEIFEDPATTMRAATNPTGKIPKYYMIAAPQDTRMKLNTQLVSGQEFYQKSHMDNGFFILHPSHDLYNYYVNLHHILDTDGSVRHEQNLLTYAHRADGPMPWQPLGSGWNLKDASQSDYEKGLKSINHKWWRPFPDDFIGDRIAMSMDEMIAYLNH
ncbi:hypothetical protein N7447_008756 [Penicillium robsamsonii]|uniref:uncharacterized protein n=1 Tax=Penicillium robsamsonii TaxID=1792511 RepID=UPI002547207C|nr:uncharacterized protein N7447_008756 [Penicillium robsamsonii]KAJ5816523.1 hypothetical protein N7447_008756 [Penicillium robsamsonii]